MKNIERYLNNENIRKRMDYLLSVFMLFLSCSNNSNLNDIKLTPSPIPTIMSAETMIANPDYLSECSVEYPDTLQKQVGYKGIYPGVSTKQDLTRILGRPTEIIQVIPSEVEWLYDTEAFILEKNLVSAIYTEGTETLVEYLSILGCPSIIFAVDGNQHPAGDYKNLIFAYPYLGINIYFNNFPIQLTNFPIQVGYEPAQNLNDFLNEYYFLLNPIRAKPVFWYEAVE